MKSFMSSGPSDQVLDLFFSPGNMKSGSLAAKYSSFPNSYSQMCHLLLSRWCTATRPLPAAHQNRWEWMVNYLVVLSKQNQNRASTEPNKKQKISPSASRFVPCLPHYDYAKHADKGWILVHTPRVFFFFCWSPSPVNGKKKNKNNNSFPQRKMNTANTKDKM